MKDISSKIYKEIKSNSIKPTPVWRFSLKEKMIWIIVFLSVSLMIISSGIIISIIFETNWEVFNYSHLSLINYLEIITPYFWFVVFVLSSYLFFLIIRRTKHGYRIENKAIIVFSSAIILIMSVLMQIHGYGMILDKFSSSTIPIYEGYEDKMLNDIAEPERGLIIGKVVRQDDNVFILDYKNKMWELATNDNNLLKYASSCHIVMIYGKVENSNKIIPEKIRPIYKNHSLVEYHPGCN